MCKPVSHGILTSQPATNISSRFTEPHVPVVNIPRLRSLYKSRVCLHIKNFIIKVCVPVLVSLPQQSLFKVFFSPLRYYLTLTTLFPSLPCQVAWCPRHHFSLFDAQLKFSPSSDSCRNPRCLTLFSHGPSSYTLLTPPTLNTILPLNIYSFFFFLPLSPVPPEHVSLLHPLV